MDGAVVGARSDLYSVGCILDELLVGERVFESADPRRGWGVTGRNSAPDRRRPRGDAALVLGLVAKEPVDRPSGAAAVCGALLPQVTALAPLPGFADLDPDDPSRLYSMAVGRQVEREERRAR